MHQDLDVLVAGGSGSARLRSTLLSLGDARVWCAVRDEQEAAACTGLADPILLDPWPGATTALDVLAERSRIERRGSAVLLLRAGQMLRRGEADRLVESLAIHSGILVLTGSRREARAVRAKVRTQPGATFEPGAGVALDANTFHALHERGWLRGTTITVAEARACAGTIRARARAFRGTLIPSSSSTTVTVLIPAHNEEAWIGQTLRSLDAQTHPPDEVIVIDDGSTDSTGAIARALGARVLRPLVRQGQKATAINYGLGHVTTDAVVILDADTQFHPDAIRHLLLDLDKGNDATCGAVLPLLDQGVWARGRTVEYSTAIRIHKRVQKNLGAVFVLSGCIAAFRAESLRAIGGFSERTITDDLDATWALHTAGYKVSYQPRAISYTVEPPSWALYKAQMRRWGAAIFQTLPFHFRQIHRKPALALIIVAAIWDIVTVPLLMVASIALLALGKMQASWIIGVWGAFAMLVSIACAVSVVGVRRGLAAFPASLVMTWTNMYFLVEAFVREWVLRRKRLAWVKGH